MISYKCLFFNPNLFTISEQPIRFHLDGYANHDAYEIATIVEAFGGKLSEPDDSTIIFSEPGRPATTNYARFHIQYLCDCIAFRQLQDLEKYRIPLIRQHFLEDAIKQEFVKSEQYNDDILYRESALIPEELAPTSSNAEVTKLPSREIVNQPLKGVESLIGSEIICETYDNNNNRRFIGKITSASSSLGKQSHHCVRNFKGRRADNVKGSLPHH